MKKFLISSVAAGLIASVFTGCLKEKKIPTEQIVTIYDSNLKETTKLSPLDTMYVKIGGMSPNQLHEIDITDPNDKLISKLVVKSNDEGTIGPIPAWYDVGLAKDENGTYKITYNKDIAVKSFYVKVKSLENSDTDFQQPFFVLLKKPSDDSDIIKPIVSAVSAEDGNTSNTKITHTFFETGSKTANGSDSNLTKVYVKADVIPNMVDKEKINQVDIYVVPFAGAQFEEGMDLENIAITYRKGINITDEGNYASLSPTLIWDLNKGPKLINPGDSNNAYSIIIDTNRNGKLDIGEDVDNDGKYDKYIDAIAGQGAAGFIVMNTEANDLNYVITDKDGNKIDTIGEHTSGDKTDLYLNMANIPTNEENVSIYVIDEDASDLPNGYDLEDVRDNNSHTTADIEQPDNNTTFLPYIKQAEVINTKKDTKYSYTKNVDKNKKLDIVVDVNKNDTYDKGVDYYLPNAITITPFDGDIYTANKDDENTTTFNEANSDANTTVYIEVNGTKDSCDDLKYAYLYTASQTPEDGDELFGQILRKEVAINAGCKTEFLDTNKTFEDGTLKIINPTDKNNKYVIVLDKNDNHKYDADDDKLLYINFKDTSANALPDVSYINLASGGLMGQPYEHWVDTPYTSAYDYRDVFKVDAEDTVPNEYWWARYYMTKGVKVVWNPYIRDRGWWWFHRYSTYIDEKGVENPSPFYQNQLVDLYIVNADKYPLYKNMKLNDSMDVRGHHYTLPVQFSCRNGAYLQTIWKAPLKVGKYYVIVDVNRNGKIDDGVDFIDAVTKTGVTIKEDPSVVGFRVEE